MNAGHCETSVSKLHNGLEILLSLSKVKIDVANIVDRQTESSYCCIQPAPFFLFNLLALSLITSHPRLCGLTVAARAILQQHRGHNVCVHVNASYGCYAVLHAQIFYGLVLVCNF